jgi:hypothetical protein
VFSIVLQELEAVGCSGLPSHRGTASIAIEIGQWIVGGNEAVACFDGMREEDCSLVGLCRKGFKLPCRSSYEEAAPSNTARRFGVKCHGPELPFSQWLC